MGSSAVGSEKYFVNWDTFKCVKDCPVGSGTDCGGLSDRPIKRLAAVLL